jgi:hypothetical protein
VIFKKRRKRGWSKRGFFCVRFGDAIEEGIFAEEC